MDSAHALRVAEAQDFWQWHEFVDQPLVETITGAGGRVIAWTSNTPGEWRVLRNMGVAGLCTDLPLARESDSNVSLGGILLDAGA